MMLLTDIHFAHVLLLLLYKLAPPEIKSKYKYNVTN